MQVSDSEGLANHAGPESCAGFGNGVPEALTGECAGRVLVRYARGDVHHRALRRRQCATTARRSVYDLSTLEQPCCIRDGGRPSGAGLQELAPNHLKLQRSQADVGSGQEKAGYRSSGVDQEDERKGTAEDVSKAEGRRQNRGESFPREQSGRALLTAQMASGRQTA